MGVLKTSKNQVLLAGETKNAQEKGKWKGKEKRYTKFEPKEEFDPLDRALGSKKDKHNRFENTKCSYCNK